MLYSMSYIWYDVMCNVGICKSKSTLRDTSYHIRRMTGWALSYCGRRVARCTLCHKVVLHCDVTPRYTVTSLRVTLWRHSALRCDVTPRYTVTSLRITLWRHSALRCDVTTNSSTTDSYRMKHGASCLIHKQNSSLLNENHHRNLKKKKISSL